jgi:hypothetical protein
MINLLWGRSRKGVLFNRSPMLAEHLMLSRTKKGGKKDVINIASMQE